MSFKFNVGQAVEYKPTGGMIGLYTVVRQMPEEFRAFDHKYRIKSEEEGFERNVLECHLREPDKQQSFGDNVLLASRQDRAPVDPAEESSE